MVMMTLLGFGLPSGVLGSNGGDRWSSESGQNGIGDAVEEEEVCGQR